MKEIDDYSARLGLKEPMTLATLIDSHQRLRDECIRLRVESQAAWSDARVRGYQAGLALNTSRHIHLDQLRTMTLDDIIDLIGCPNDPD